MSETEPQNVTTVCGRSHRVGTLTLGIVMILAGVLFLLHIFLPVLTFGMIFRFWPVIFILLGVEILMANRNEMHFTYDAGAVVLMILLTLFAMSMAVAETVMNHYGIFF